MIKWTAKGIETRSERYRETTADLWDDIALLAERFKSLGGADSPEGHLAWHHLILSVGNFKRQAPIYLAPLRATRAPEATDEGPRVVWIPEDGGFSLRAEDPSSWVRLVRIHGIETATATTLLAVLWPEQHLIMDTWVFNVANAMRADGDAAYMASTDQWPYPEPMRR